jgi:hypothetical protein
MKISYTLSDIAGFNEVLCENTNANANTNYFTVSEYSTKSNEKYKIVRYNKDILAVDLIPSYGLLRSVIINSLGKVIGFAPPKSLPADQFLQKYSIQNEYVCVQEFVEGTMINVFYDDSISDWKIATRNTVDAEVSFYQKTDGKTFNVMFREACQQNNFNFETLNQKFCYSFVLQHPDNRIVVPFKTPQLYLVEVYMIVQSSPVTDGLVQSSPKTDGLVQSSPVTDGLLQSSPKTDGLVQSSPKTDSPTTVDIVPQNLALVKANGEWSQTTIKFPETYVVPTYSELIEIFASANTPYNIMGIVIKNVVTNERTKIRNPIYEEIRHLKGNHCKLQYQYLTLRKEGKLPEFLKYYPESKKDFSECRNQVHMFTNALHQNYMACYIRKEKPLSEFGPQYRTHMYKIHEQYINVLKPNNFYVNNTIVQKYVNNLHPSLLMHGLNFHLRKQNVDTIKATNINI